MIDKAINQATVTKDKNNKGLYVVDFNPVYANSCGVEASSKEDALEKAKAWLEDVSKNYPYLLIIPEEKTEVEV